MCSGIKKRIYYRKPVTGKQVFYDKFSNGTYVYLLIVRLYAQQIFYDKFLVF